MKPKQKFDKHDLYFRAVQDNEQAIAFLERVYRAKFHKPLRNLGEDFCGTFALSYDWIKKGKGRKSVSVDLSTAPLNYGQKNYFSRLPEAQKKYLTVLKKDVRDRTLPKAEAIAAFNFSYFIFKERQDLLAYFKNCYRRLDPKGLLALDCFGGSGTLEPNVESKRVKKFTYYWEQKSYDPITHNARFSIHFKRDGEKKRRNVFHYDWRMWTLAELKDLLSEAGFKDISVYWEGSNKRGGGNGIFTKKTHEANCEGWIAYVTGVR